MVAVLTASLQVKLSIKPCQSTKNPVNPANSVILSKQTTCLSTILFQLIRNDDAVPFTYWKLFCNFFQKYLHNKKFFHYLCTVFWLRWLDRAGSFVWDWPCFARKARSSNKLKINNYTITPPTIPSLLTFHEFSQYLLSKSNLKEAIRRCKSGVGKNFRTDNNENIKNTLDKLQTVYRPFDW